jgi:hypothetical protein
MSASRPSPVPENGQRSDRRDKVVACLDVSHIIIYAAVREPGALVGIVTGEPHPRWHRTGAIRPRFLRRGFLSEPRRDTSTPGSHTNCWIIPNARLDQYVDG